ncbi:hypothetical protein QJ043_05455 [Olsenella sp. YH-ols2217]|uniref:Uncharacterized protein n=1 Tax=Kribbibacterium absianum TaxID=3044210 RepID=A0ABT6ZKG2_9ACTN|nr:MULTISPECIES: hypothetical protein [unclassified Olsenella]MDJ1122514.1 hypothetical protein [Olsenella sp. YH-ols2216]MDJ1129526.1 hypothetical protein [Olsenella sp. YH-ols2217]
MADVDVNGIWKTEVDTPMGHHTVEVELHDNGGDLTGDVKVGSHRFPVENGTVRGEHVHFEVTVKRGIIKATGKIEATMNGEALEGTASAMGQKVKFVARRS